MAYTLETILARIAASAAVRVESQTADRVLLDKPRRYGVKGRQVEILKVPGTVHTLQTNVGRITFTADAKGEVAPCTAGGSTREATLVALRCVGRDADAAVIWREIKALAR